MSMSPEDVKAFMRGEYDFGERPATVALSEDQKKLAALGMAVNATLVQFIQEGIIPYDQQIHFMGHLQDFANRLYNGESIKMPDTRQTLQVNSQGGNLFYEASLDALTQGSANWEKIKDLGRKAHEEQQAQGQPAEQDNVSKPTFH